MMPWSTTMLVINGFDDGQAFSGAKPSCMVIGWINHIPLVLTDAQNYYAAERLREFCHGHTYEFCCNREYAFETHLKLKSHEILFARNL